MVDDPAFMLITDYFGKLDDDGELGIDYEKSFVAINLDAERDNFTDDKLAESASINCAEINDVMRIDFMENHLSNLIDNGLADSDLHPSCSTLTIESSDGRQALVALGVCGYSFSGITREWFGIFKKIEDLKLWLRNKGLFLSTKEFSGLDNEKKISFWIR